MDTNNSDKPTDEDLTHSAAFENHLTDNYFSSEEDNAEESNLVDEQNKTIDENIPETKDSTNEQIQSNKAKDNKQCKKKKRK